MMKILTQSIIISYFEKYKGYISNPPEDIVLRWVFKYLLDKNYKAIMKNFGIVYLLIVLKILEDFDMFEECQEVYLTIIDYNLKFKTNYKTHIRYK